MAETKEEDELLALIRLTMVAGVGPLASRALLAHFSSRPAGCWRRVGRSLRDVDGVGPKLAEKIAQARQELDAEAELALCRRMEVRVLPCRDPEYPSSLPEYSGPSEPAIHQGAAGAWRPTGDRGGRLSPLYTLCVRARPNDWRVRGSDGIHGCLGPCPAASTRPLIAGRSRLAAGVLPCLPTGWPRFTLPA